MTSELSQELKFCQMAVKPLLQALQRITAALHAASAAAARDPAPLRLLLSSARLACRVFFSLNSPGLTEVICPHSIEKAELKEQNEHVIRSRKPKARSIMNMSFD
jgi:hypothetical protein